MSEPWTSPIGPTRARVEDLAARLAGPGPEVDQVVGRADQVAARARRRPACCPRRAAARARAISRPTSWGCRPIVGSSRT